MLVFVCELGIHAEGPVVATLGGLPDSSRLVRESDEWFEAFVRKVTGSQRVLRMMTISPSCEARRDQDVQTKENDDDDDDDDDDGMECNHD